MSRGILYLVQALDSNMLLLGEDEVELSEIEAISVIRVAENSSMQQRAMLKVQFQEIFPDKTAIVMDERIEFCRFIPLPAQPAEVPYGSCVGGFVPESGPDPANGSPLLNPKVQAALKEFNTRIEEKYLQIPEAIRNQYYLAMGVDGATFYGEFRLKEEFR